MFVSWWGGFMSLEGKKPDKLGKNDGFMLVLLWHLLTKPKIYNNSSLILGNKTFSVLLCNLTHCSHH